MKIVLAAQTYGPVNGPGVFTASLARALAAQGERTVVLSPSPSLRSHVRDDDGVTVAQVRSLSLAPLYPEVRTPVAPASPIRELLATLRPDLVHLQDHYPLSESVARACVAMGIPLVATNHFVPENIIPHVPIVSRFEAGVRALERELWRMVARVFAHARAVTSPTETAAARLRPHLDGVPVRAISCGVDLARFRTPTARDRTRREFGLAADDRVFVYVGRLDVEKRVDVLIRAIAAVSSAEISENADIKLLLVGHGRQHRSLRRLAARLGVERRVVFAGFMPPARLPAILGSGDYFAMPGDVELQSIATLEAMAAGLPVLAARAGALPELVEDGVDGALFRPNDSADAAARMIDLTHADARWQDMSRASRRRARRHDLRFTVEAFRDLYAEVVEGS